MKTRLLSYSRTKILLLTGVFSVWLLFLLFCRMYLVEPQMTVSRHYRVNLKNWHKEHNGMKVAILADIHLKNTPQDFARLHQCVDLINQERPDLVFLLGDYLFGNKRRIYRNPLPHELGAELARLNPSLGSFAVLGNHDNLYGRRTLRRMLEKAHVTVLENEFRSLMIAGKMLQILGLPDTGTRGEILWKIQWPDPAIPTIVLSHSPVYFDVLQLPYELMLAGHNHGGQIRLPLIGAFPARHLFLSPFKTGWVKQKGHLLLNNNGFGTTGPEMRLNCPPEVIFLTIYPAVSGK